MNKLREELPRLLWSAAGGAVAVMAFGKLAGLVGGRCAFLCDPVYGIPIGAFWGMLAFRNIGRD